MQTPVLFINHVTKKDEAYGFLYSLSGYVFFIVDNKKCDCKWSKYLARIVLSLLLITLRLEGFLERPHFFIRITYNVNIIPGTINECCQ